ncbi:MAG: DUF547 domain-containing protein [Blastocatellia bacterium]
MKAGLCLALIMGITLAFMACAKNAAPTAPNATATPAAAFSHRALDELLHDYVDEQGRVDYAGLRQARARLDQYLATLGPAQPQTFATDQERLAFWINSYNAFVVADVLDQVYGKVKSVQDVKGFFDQKTHRIAGETLSLKEIETRGRALKDPRIHFAVNCASLSCPKLQRAAYNGAQLDLQLTRAGREFLGDMTRGMNYDPGRNMVFLSPIFQWYAADFITGQTTASEPEMLEAAKKFMPADVSQFLTVKKMEAQWLKYNWALNAQEKAGDTEKAATPSPVTNP